MREEGRPSGRLQILTLFSSQVLYVAAESGQPDAERDTNIKSEHDDVIDRSDRLEIWVTSFRSYSTIALFDRFPFRRSAAVYFEGDFSDFGERSFTRLSFFSRTRQTLSSRPAGRRAEAAFRTNPTIR